MARPCKRFKIEDRWLSYAEAAKQYAVPAAKIRQRLWLGWSPEEAVGLVVRPRELEKRAKAAKSNSK